MVSIDVDLPLEIDDEFWSSPDKYGFSAALGQPTDRPSIVAAFNVYAKLSLIYDCVIRNLVSQLTTWMIP